MKAIVCVDSKWGIGRGNDLLFSLPLDMKFFRETTKEKIVVMGGKTLRSFPNAKPLPKRINIVLSKTEERDDCIICKDFTTLLDTLKKYNSDDIFIIGGGSFYSMMLPYCDEAFVTKVKSNGEATVFFPNLDKNPDWTLVEEGEELETNGHYITFNKYQNEKVINI